MTSFYVTTTRGRLLYRFHMAANRNCDTWFSFCSWNIVNGSSVRIISKRYVIGECVAVRRKVDNIFRGNKYIFNIWMCVKGESTLTWRSSCLIIISSGWQQEELCSTGLMKDTEKLFTFLCFALGLFSLLLPLSLPLSVSLSHPLIIYGRCHRSERAACVCLTRCSCISFNKDMSLITNVSHRQEDTLANCKLTPEWWQAMLSCLLVSHECVML